MEQLAYSTRDAAKALSVGRTQIYVLIGNGALDARKLGGRTVILASSLQAYLASLPAAEIHMGGKSPAH